MPARLAADLEQALPAKPRPQFCAQSSALDHVRVCFLFRKVSYSAAGASPQPLDPYHHLPQVSVKHLMARRMSSTLLPFTFSSCNAELCIIPSSLYELPCNRKRDLRSLDHAPVRLADVQILDRENRSGAVKRYSNLLPGHAEKKLWATVRPEAPQCGNLL